MAAPDLSLADIEVLAGDRQLRVGGRPIEVGPRAFDVLCVLASRAGQVVPKRELMRAVWAGMVVQEDNLAVQVGNLRKALGPQRIVTVPGRGYCLVTPHASGAPAAEAPERVATHLLGGAATSSGAAPLVGRDGDVRRVLGLLREFPLVTLTGAGGVGKTRIAQQVFAEWVTATPARGCWSDLSGVADAQRVVATIGRAIGGDGVVPETPQALCRLLSGQQLLIVVDNAEQWAAQVADVVGLLVREIGGVRWLVTSQVPLALQHEHVVHVAPLALPPHDAGVAQAQSFGAVQLFAQRALADDPHFALDATNVADVVEVCHRLEGLPLALEMAASRMPLLGLPKMRALLDDRLQWLRSGFRGMPERQRTLRATLQWSYELLDQREQAALQRLAVFPGGFWLDMGLDVMAGAVPDDERWPWVDTLAALVDRSLVEARQGDVVRYRMLDATRAFALERLAASGAEGEARDRQARALIRHLRDLQRRSDHEQLAFDEALFLTELELENAHAAMTWSIGHDRSLAIELMPLYNGAARERDRTACAAAWQATEALYADDLPAPLRRPWAVAYSYFLVNRGAHAAARRWHDEATSLPEELDDADARFLMARVSLALARETGGDIDAGIATLTALSTSCAPRPRLFVPVHIGHAEVARGRPADALPWTRQAVEEARRAGSVRWQLQVLGNLAAVELMVGLVDEAIRHLCTCVDEARRHKLDYALTQTDLNLLGAFMKTGDLTAASAAAAEGWPLAARFGMVPYWLDPIAELACAKGLMREAVAIIAHVDASRAAAGTKRERYVQALVDAWMARAVAGLAPDDLERARRRGRDATPAEVEAIVATVLGG